MKTKTEIMSVANALNTEAYNALARYEEERKSLIDAIIAEGIDSAYEKFSVLLGGIETILRGVSADGVMFPGFLSKTSTTNVDKLTSVTIVVSSKLRAENKFKFKRAIEINEDMVENISSFYLSALFDAYYFEEAKENIDEINEVLAGIYKENGIEKKLFFAVTREDGRVVEIDNDKVVLKADVDKALDASNLGLMPEDNEYSKLIYDEAVANIVNFMSMITITPEILKKRNNMIQSLIDLHTKKHAHKIIRESYHKQAKYVKSEREGVAYVSTQIDGTDVFALVKMQEGGAFETVLAPFDTDKLVTVDVDITKYIA